MTGTIFLQPAIASATRLIDQQAVCKEREEDPGMRPCHPEDLLLPDERFATRDDDDGDTELRCLIHDGCKDLRAHLRLGLLPPPVHVTASACEVAARGDADDHNWRDKESLPLVLLAYRCCLPLVMQDDRPGDDKCRVRLR